MKRESGGHEGPREARLRREAADLYPGLTAEAWMQAATVADTVWALRLGRGEGSTYLAGRILHPEHFEFRHGEGEPAGSCPHRRRARDGSRLYG
jgi:hypothetical protein